MMLRAWHDHYEGPRVAYMYLSLNMSKECYMMISEDGLRWKHDLVAQAAAKFRIRQSERVNYRKLIYGKGKINCFSMHRTKRKCFILC